MNHDTSFVMNGIRWVPYVEQADWGELDLRKKLAEKDAMIRDLRSGVMKPPVTPTMCHDCMEHLDGPHCTQCRFWHELLLKTAKAHGFNGGGLNPGGGYLEHPEHGHLQLSAQNDEYDFHSLIEFICKKKIFVRTVQ